MVVGVKAIDVVGIVSEGGIVESIVGEGATGGEGRGGGEEKGQSGRGRLEVVGRRPGGGGLESEEICKRR